MTAFLALIAIIFIVAVIVWNVVPGIREKMRGWSTVIEGAAGTAIYYFGGFADALKEGQSMGYVPHDISGYVPMVLLLWLIVKRWQTSTPIGRK